MLFSLLICFVILLEMFSILPSLTSAMWLSKLYYFVVFGFFRSQEKIKTLFVAVLAICCSTMKKVPNHFCFSFVSFFHFCPCNCFQKLIFIYRDFCRLWCLFHFIYSSSQWYLSCKFLFLCRNVFVYNYFFFPVIQHISCFNALCRKFHFCVIIVIFTSDGWG